MIEATIYIARLTTCKNLTTKDPNHVIGDLLGWLPDRFDSYLTKSLNRELLPNRLAWALI